MKKLILSAAVIAFAAISLRAQEIPERKKDESKPIVKEKVIDKKQRETLNLTEDQKTKLKAMNQDIRKKMEELRKQDNLTIKEYREKMVEYRKDRQTQFESLLTPEQKAQMDKNREALKARTKEYGKRRDARMKEELKLTDEQSAKLAENRRATMEKVKTIREDKSLTDDQRREKVKEAMKSQKEGMKRLLTEEQLKKMKENRKDHHKKRRPEVI